MALSAAAPRPRAASASAMRLRRPCSVQAASLAEAERAAKEKSSCVPKSSSAVGLAGACRAGPPRRAAVPARRPVSASRLALSRSERPTTESRLAPRLPESASSASSCCWASHAETCSLSASSIIVRKSPSARARSAAEASPPLFLAAPRRAAEKRPSPLRFGRRARMLLELLPAETDVRMRRFFCGTAGRTGVGETPFEKCENIAEELRQLE